ncbi:hypothetical protein QJS66_13485 [Kocuria rhizophila]|nr:hypothetical protein QJS66_13485 [Kocuria rhizophila]
MDGLVEATEDGRARGPLVHLVLRTGTAWQRRSSSASHGRRRVYAPLRGRAAARMTPCWHDLHDPQLGRAPRARIGHTWNRASTHGTGTNAESKLLLMTHAFEELGCRRATRPAGHQQPRAPPASSPPWRPAGRRARREPPAAQRGAAGHRGLLVLEHERPSCADRAGSAGGAALRRSGGRCRPRGVVSARRGNCTGAGQRGEAGAVGLSQPEVREGSCP